MAHRRNGQGHTHTVYAALVVLFCGIDVGTTNLKVLLLGESGETLWVKSVSAPHLHDGLGVVTDATALVSTIENLIIEGWTALGQGRAITAISSAGIGEDGVAIDANLIPLGHAIQWNDRRGESFAARLGETETAKHYPAILFDFTTSAGKWAWLQAHKPEELSGAKHWLTMTDYPLAAWSGTAFMSATLAPRTGCYDVFTRAWIPILLQKSYAPPLPKLVEAGGIVGTMRNGLLVAAGAASPKTLLVAGGHDHLIAASAVRRILNNARIDSMGTANATYGETATLTPDRDMQGLYATLPISGARGAAVIGMTEFSVTLGQHVDDVGALYKSLLTIQNASDIPTDIRNALAKMTQHTKTHWSAMTKTGVPPAPIYAMGGWSRCPALMQTRADIFGEPITVVDEPEMVAMGAALFAAQAAGLSLTFSAANHSHVVEPTSN
jgi:xylulokinase